MTDDSRPEEAKIEPVITTSKTVTTVFDRLLMAIHDGTLIPGQHISDSEIAEQFGVSRTPVREAIQRLREIGLVEASSGRFTRVVNVTPEQTLQAYIVWRSLYSVLIAEVIPTASERTLILMREDNVNFRAAVASMKGTEIAKANLDFFSRLPPESANAALQRAILSVVYILSLGSVYPPSVIDLWALGDAQELLLEAVQKHDLTIAREAMDVLGEITVPLT